MKRIFNNHAKTVLIVVAFIFLCFVVVWQLKANSNPIQLTWVPNHAKIDYAKLDSELYELITDVNREYSFSYHKDLRGNITGLNVSTRSTAFSLEPSDVDQLINAINHAASEARTKGIMEPKFFPKSKMTLTFEQKKDEGIIELWEMQGLLKNRPKGTYTATLDWRSAEVAVNKLILIPSLSEKLGYLPTGNPDTNYTCIVSVPLSNAIPSTSVRLIAKKNIKNNVESSFSGAVGNYFRVSPAQFGHTRSFEDPELESIPKENFEVSNDRLWLWITVHKFQKNQALTSQKEIEDYCRQKILWGDYHFAKYLQPVKPEKKEIGWIQKATRNPNWKN